LKIYVVKYKLLKNQKTQVKKLSHLLIRNSRKSCEIRNTITSNRHKHVHFGSISMFILGVLLFYLINPEENKNLEIIKNTGTFVGLSGIGVTLAGILVYLLNKNEQPIKENYDV